MPTGTCSGGSDNELPLAWAFLLDFFAAGALFEVVALRLRLFVRLFVQAPGGAYIWRGDLTEGFSRYRFGGLIFGGAYTRRGLFSEFYGI